MKQYQNTDYSVTEDGRVWSNKSGKFLKTYVRKSGYNSVSAGLVHRLVAETYLPNPNGLPEVDHIDNNKSNNHISNLQWVTRKENMSKAKSDGLLGKNQQPKGSMNGRSKITEDIVKEIRTLYGSEKYTQKKLADIYGINQRSISNIVKRKSWRHI